MHRHLPSISSRLRTLIFLPRRKEAKFIHRLCTGESTAWTQLVESWSPQLYNYLIYNLATEKEARQLLHLVFNELVQTLTTTQPRYNLTVLIFSIAYRQVLSYRQQHPNHILPRLLPNRQQVEAGQQDLHFLHRFRQLSPEHQQVCLLRFLCDVNLSDLAQIVGQPEDVLTQTFHRLAPSPA